MKRLMHEIIKTTISGGDTMKCTKNAFAQIQSDLNSVLTQYDGADIPIIAAALSIAAEGFAAQMNYADLQVYNGLKKIVHIETVAVNITELKKQVTEQNENS